MKRTIKLTLEQANMLMNEEVTYGGIDPGVVSQVGAQLKPAGLLVITDTMLNRVTLNWKRGKRTYNNRKGNPGGWKTIVTKRSDGGITGTKGKSRCPGYRSCFSR